MATDARIEEIKQVLGERLANENATELALQVLRGAEEGLELEQDDFEGWLEDRFKYQLVWLSRTDYSRALTRALWLAPRFAATDFGTSRQRDFGQVWTDTARGFLGEIALGRFFTDRFGAELTYDTRRGLLKDFLSRDVVKIELDGNPARPLKLDISVKTTKFNGRWLDVTGAQIQHSQIFVLVKVGIIRVHLLAFMKGISFLRDKLFKEAKELGELTDDLAKELWDEIPDFEDLPAYVAGFADKGSLNMPIHTVTARAVGRPARRVKISAGVGLFSPGALRAHPAIKRIDPAGALGLEIDPIIKSLTNQRFLANSGSLSYGKENWLKLLERL